MRPYSYMYCAAHRDRVLQLKLAAYIPHPLRIKVHVVPFQNIYIYTFINDKYSIYTICKIYIQCSHRRRLLDGSTHCAGGCSTDAPVSGPENVFETYGKE